ncbi:MAG: hypothetical protein RRB22_02640 [Gammaproteobacteria bacterium]|nr:hypothetical protein [Gammaproteobacteria bacterium]
MVDNKKQNVSVRMSSADLKRIKDIAKRMNVRDSDVFRFAVRSTLTKLTPLGDDHVHGKDLLPVFVGGGSELTSYFNLDSSRLERIINEGVDDPEKMVDREDVEMIVMANIQESYVLMRLKHLQKKQPEQRDVGLALREYLLEKYIGGFGPGTLKVVEKRA